MHGAKLILLLLVCLVLGQTTRWPVADTLSLALGTILILAFLWSRFSLRGVTVERLLAADRSSVGGVLQETVRLHNRSAFPKLWLEVLDRSTLPGHNAGRVFNLKSRSSVDWETATLCVRRGVYTLGPVLLQSGDPLGLFPVRQFRSGAREVVIYPAMAPLANVLAPVAALDGGALHNRRSPVTTPSIAGVRDYVTGDGYNRISWSQTARRGRLMVKEFDQDQTADLWLVLDLDQAVHQAATLPLNLTPDSRGNWPVEAWLDSTLEYCVTIVSSLARHFLDEGRNVGLIASGAHLETLNPDRGDRQASKLLETLAVVEADGRLPLAELLLAEQRRFSRQTGLVVVTPSVNDAWPSALATVAGRRAPATAILVEPSSFGPASSSILAANALAAMATPVQLVRYGDNLSLALGVVANRLDPVGRDVFRV